MAMYSKAYKLNMFPKIVTSARKNSTRVESNSQITIQSANFLSRLEDQLQKIFEVVSKVSGSMKANHHEGK